MLYAGATHAGVQASSIPSQDDLRGSGISKMSIGDFNGARRDFEAAVTLETAYFSSLGETQRDGEAPHLIELLTLDGTASLESSAFTLAAARWKTALALYRAYLPIIARKFAPGDELVASGRYPAAFAFYAHAFRRYAPSTVPILQAAEAEKWSTVDEALHDAKVGLYYLQANKFEDLIRGIVGVCRPSDAASTEGAFIYSIEDDTIAMAGRAPHVDSTSLSAIRLLLVEMARHPNERGTRPGR